MPGTISLALSQQFDKYGNVLSGGKLYFYRAGTVSTPQNAFYDSALTDPLPNPYTLDAAGRIPFFFLEDGSIKVSLYDRHGTSQLSVDNIPVIGSSSGEGGGSTVDPTTVWQTGQLVPWYTTGVQSGFVRANGRTIGSATSGATERANADTQALFLFLYAADANLTVSGGRGASAAADWAANKTIALPDLKGRVPAGLDDMGGSAAGRLTATYFGATATVLGAAGGEESQTLLTANLPAYTPAGSLSLSTSVSTSVTTTISESPHSHNVPVPLQGDLGHVGGSPTSKVSQGNNQTGATTLNVTSDPASTGISADSSATSTATPTGSFAGTAQGGSSTPFDKTQPTILVTYYIKL